MNILLIFACLKRSVQTGIDQFLIDMDTEFDTYSKQAFSKERQRILPEAFEELHRISTEFFYKEVDYKTYCGYPSAELMQYIEQSGFKYIMRCSTSFLANMKKDYREHGIIKHKFKRIT